MKIAINTISDGYFSEFDTMLATNQEHWDMSYLKDLNRKMIFLLLEKIQQKADSKYIPLLENWAEVDYRKVRERIHSVISHLTV